MYTGQIGQRRAEIELRWQKRKSARRQRQGGRQRRLAYRLDRSLHTTRRSPRTHFFSLARQGVRAVGTQQRQITRCETGEKNGKEEAEKDLQRKPGKGTGRSSRFSVRIVNTNREHMHAIAWEIPRPKITIIRFPSYARFYFGLPRKSM